MTSHGLLATTVALLLVVSAGTAGAATSHAPGGAGIAPQVGADATNRPVASNDIASVEAGGSVTVDVLANDNHSDGTLNASAVTIVDGPESGTVSVDGTTGAVAYTHDGSPVEKDTFSYTVEGSDGTVSEPATVSVVVYEGQRSVPVSDGLVVRLESGTGVATTGSTIDAWADQSRRGNDLSAEGNPTLLPGAAPSGAPAVSFDGNGDALSTSVLSDMPLDDENRSVFLVASYQSPGFGGFTWGQGEPNEAFGTVVNDAGELTVQGWGQIHDYPSGVQGTGAGWLTQSVVHADSRFVHYRNGTQIDADTQNFNTSDGEIVVGAEIARLFYLDMEVAAVLVYDRALSDAERRQVEQYLQANYLNTPPTALDDAATVPQGATVDVDVLANDTDPDGTLNASSVSIVDAPDNGSVSVNASTGVVTYAHDGSRAATDTFTYTVADDDGVVSDRATVSVDVTGINTLPTAAVTASPSPALVGQTVTFDASGSMDADGSVVEYRWDVGADGTVDATTSAPTFNESFASAGTRNVSVTVVDDDGATDAATATVAVDPAVTKLVDVGLEGAPDGLESYTITVRVDGGEVRSIEQVTPADGRFRVQAGGVNETFAEVFAYDSERSVGPFDGRRTLFEVTVVGRPDANVTTNVSALTDDSRSDIDPARLSVEVANASGSPFDAPVPGAGTTARPTDPDGDGLYEDVDGNGAFRFPDVVALLFADYGTINGDVDRQAALDFDGDGSVGFLDVVDLLFRL